MKALAVDLRSPYRAPLWAWALIGILFAIAVTVGSFAYRKFLEVDLRKAELADLHRQWNQPLPAPTTVIQKMPYDSSAREMLALATSDWPSMLTAIESVGVVGVTPTALEIIPGERWIRVEVEFADYARLLEYIDSLNAGDPRPRWGLVQAQANSQSGKPAVLGSATGAGATSTATLRGTW